MSRIDGYNSYAQINSMYDANKTNENKRVQTPPQVPEKSNTPVELSERAQKLLEELKDKYKNADFMVADFTIETRLNPRDNAKIIEYTKEYSVLIDPETLEQMAADEGTKNKYLDMLDQATNALGDIREQLKDQEEGSEIVNVGITISGDGTMLFYAQLEHSSELQKERIEAAREAHVKETKDARKEEAKERLENYKETTVKASSVEELLQKIKEIDWDKIPMKEKALEGGKIDFSV